MTVGAQWPDPPPRHPRDPRLPPPQECWRPGHERVVRGGPRGEGHGQLAHGQAARTTSVSKLLVGIRFFSLDFIIVIRTEQRSLVFYLHIFDHHGFFML